MAKPSEARSEDLKLKDYLCFAVYSANLAFGRVYRPILDRIGLTYTQYVALVALWEEDGQTVGALGEKLFLESNTLTPILKKLEAMGFVERRRDPADERQVRISLTAKGKQLGVDGIGGDLATATGLGDDFPAVQQAVVRLRDNLLRHSEAQHEQDRGGVSL